MTNLLPVSTDPRPRNRICRKPATLVAALLLLTGCAVGPRYQQPSATIPQSYKEAGNWQPAQPSDNVIRGKWWEIYGDSQLNSLEEQVAVSNQTLKSAQEAFLQARSLVGIRRADYYPVVGGTAGATRTLVSNNKPPGSPFNGTQYDDIQLPANVSWEPDLFNRVRYNVENARAGAQASAADLENLALSLHAELASDYFQLRALDLEAAILGSAVTSFQNALDLTQSRYQGGIASEVDVAQAQTQLQTTKAQAQDVGVERAQLEHAIAILAGIPPAEFSLAANPLVISPPVIPLGLPSDLLERRPDIAAAERQVAAQNANIGLAKTAFYPLVSLTGLGGFESGRWTALLSGPSGMWSIGASVAETIFDAGKRKRITEQQQEIYAQSVDEYRQTVLNALQEVEDNLAALRILEQEDKTQAQAVESAKQSLQLSNNRYVGGVASYLEVLTAQSIDLSNERVSAQILGRRLQASVLLIKALGGGWDRASLPTVAHANGNASTTNTIP